MTGSESGREVINFFFMLNSAEHEIRPAYKSQITNNCKFFLVNIAEHGIFSANKYENANLLQKKIHAQLSFITSGPV